MAAPFLYIKIKNPKAFAFGFFGCGTRIRTQTNRVRVCRATLTQFRNGNAIYYTQFFIFVNSKFKEKLNFIIFCLRQINREQYAARQKQYRRYDRNGFLP